MSTKDGFAPNVQYRISPGPLVGVAVVLAYIVVVFGLQLGSGLSYDEWVDTPEHALRAGVLPLAAGSLLLIAFAVYSRWDNLWRDPGRLPMTRAMYVALVFFIVCIVVRLLIADWHAVGLDLLVTTLAVGVLVGFAEETLFRGIFLRSMRTGGRSEARAALWTAVVFGLFHLPNMLVGAGVLQIGQVVLAALSGVALYLFRRYRGLIVVAMVAHGVWDVSAFLSAGRDDALAQTLSTLLAFGSMILGVVALVSIWRTDRTTVVTSTGVTTAG